MRDAIASASDLYNLLATFGVLDAIKEGSIWIAAAATFIGVACLVAKVSMTGWRAAKWSGRITKRASLAVYRRLRPEPIPEPELSIACKSILIDLQDPCAKFDEDKKVFEAGTLVVDLTNSATMVNKVNRKGDDKYDVLKDLPDHESQLVKKAALLALGRTKERDRQERLTLFACSTQQVVAERPTMGAMRRPKSA